MLVLGRKVGESILIGDTRITVVRCTGSTIKIGIEAPREVRVIRAELEGKDDAKRN